jgi:hypothetical protein
MQDGQPVIDASFEYATQILLMDLCEVYLKTAKLTTIHVYVHSPLGFS